MLVMHAWALVKSVHDLKDCRMDALTFDWRGIRKGDQSNVTYHLAFKRWQAFHSAVQKQSSPDMEWRTIIKDVEGVI